MIYWRIARHLRTLIPILERQAEFLSIAASHLSRMQTVHDPAVWKTVYKEIRNLEHQGDALLTEFRDEIARRVLLPIGLRMDLTTIAMALDDSLDVLKDSANAMLIYNPAKIDPQLQDLARIIVDEANVLRSLFPLLADVRKNATAISLQADRVKELEHDADEAYEDYVGYIFEKEPDLRELTKYKNLAELYEKATDTQKHVADCVRILLLRDTSR